MMSINATVQNRSPCHAGPAVAAGGAAGATLAAAVMRVQAVQARLEELRRRDRDLDAHLDAMLARPDVEPAAEQGS